MTTAIDHMPVLPASGDGMVVGFDYATLEPAHAQEAQAVAQRIRARMKAGIIETGLDLINVKATIGHGAFGAWIRAEFGMTDRTVQNYMRAATVFGDHSEIVSLLPSSTIYDLAAKSIPDTIRDDVIRQIGEGKRPEPSAISETIRAEKQRQREAREAERQAAKLAKLSPEQRAALDTKSKRTAASRAKREAERARQNEEYEANREREKQAAREAAELLADRLGDDLGQFKALFDAASYQFGNALRDVAGSMAGQSAGPLPDRG